jgi:hypothetical protein
VEKAIKYNFDFCAVGDAGEKGDFDSILNFIYFIQTVKFGWSIQNIMSSWGLYGPL